MELNLTSVALYGEHLRDRLLSAKPPLIKSRRQLFRTYPNTFVGSEVVSWLLKDSQTEVAPPKTDDKSKSNNNNNSDEVEMNVTSQEFNPNPETAAQIMQALLDFGVLHSLHGDFPFKNDSSLYRFTTDDGSCCGVVEALVKGRRLHRTTTCANCALLQRVCEYGQCISDECMRGSDLVVWIIEHGLASHREDAKRVCRLMFDHGIIKPAMKHVKEFIDGRPFYLFGIDYTVPAISTETFASLLNSSTPELPSSSTETNASKHQHVRRLSAQLMDLQLQDSRTRGRRKTASSSSVGSDDSGYNDIGNSLVNAPRTYESLLRSDGKHTAKALAHPDAPFTRKEMRIYPDAVGYGFIIRGSSPCYVKIVDPESPAGKSGLKAWQYITEIHNRDVTRKTHTEIEDLILNGPKCLIMTIMHPKDEDGYALVRKLYMESKKTSQPDVHIPKSFGDHNGLRRQSVPIVNKLNNLPSAQPWMKQQRKASDFGVMFPKPNARFVR